MLALLFHGPHTTALPQLPAHMRIRTAERALTLSELFAVSAVGTLQEVFYASTAIVIIPAERIGQQRPAPRTCTGTEAELVEIVLPPAGGSGHLAQADWEHLAEGMGRAEPLLRCVGNELVPLQ